MIKYYLENRPKTVKHVVNATADEVAAVIYRAATDATNQLRYVVGGDAEFYVKGRVENSDQDYFNLMNGYFLKP